MQISVRINFYEIITFRCYAAQIVFKPFTFAGYMVQDKIKHQGEIMRDILNILPGAEVWIDLTIVDH